MKTIYFLRHAKSSWKHHVEDHKRPLKGRGKKDAKLISNHVKNKFPPPQKIISSDANRAKTTAVYFKNVWEIADEDFITNPKLYDFGGQNVLEVIKGLDNNMDVVMIVGHNHAFTSLANMLGDTNINNITTCGFVAIEFNVELWEYVKYGRTVNIIFPKDLKPKEDY